MTRRSQAQRREAWLFGGGTALAAVQVASAEQLYRARGGLPDLLAGVSAGSLNAFLLAQDRPARLRELWLDVDGARWFQRLAIDFNPLDGLCTLKPLRRQINHEIAAAPIKSGIDFRVGLVDLEAKKYRSIHASELNGAALGDALIASCTQPGYHEEVCWRGKLAADGGLKHVIPNPPVIDRAPAGWTVHAVVCTPIDREHPAYELERFNAISRGIECLVDAVFAADVQRLRSWAAVGAEVYIYAPTAWPGEPFDAHPDTIRERLRIGQEVWNNRLKL